MEKVQRFADLSREEIAGLVNGKDSKNTQLVIKTALTPFRAFCEEKHRDKTQDFDEISKEELTPNFSASQETVHFHSGAFSSGCNITVNFNY